MAHRVLAVIPARLGSKRFPEKVIYPFNGKPLVSYVYQQALKAKSIDRVVIATDDDTIAAAGRQFGAEVVKTSRRHQTGSDRVAEVAAKLGGTIVINIQADNFGLKPAALDTLVKRMMAERQVRFATLARSISSDQELISPDLVKVVVDANRDALWFSRFPLPYLQDARRKKRCGEFPFLGHIGVYGFRRDALKRFASWKRTPLEKAESLEQLRILENGEKIRVLKTGMKSVEINSPGDLRKLRRIYR